MVVGVIAVRARVVRHRRAGELHRVAALSSPDGLRSMCFPQLAPEFAFAFSELFRNVDLNDNVEIAAFS